MPAQVQLGITRSEDFLELEWSCYLELVVAAVQRALVGAPAEEPRRVPEARSLHVVVGDLADAFRPERLPAQVLAAVPPAGRARQPLCRRARLVLRGRRFSCNAKWASA